MKTARKKSPKAPPALLRIGGPDIQVVQFMDYPDFSDPKGGHILLVSFGKARLADANDKEIFTGQIIVRVNTTITPASLAMISRLLQPFKGGFTMIVTGTYVTPGSYAEVYASDVVTTDINPSTTKGKGKVQIVSPQS